MKTYLSYGSAMAGAGFVLTLALYILGFHSDPSKLTAAQWIQSCLGLGISVTCIVLGTKARRAQVPATDEFGYGSALGAGVMISLFSALLALVTTFLYFGVSNPNFVEVMLRAQAATLEAQGRSADQIEQIQKISGTFMKLPMQMVFGFFGSLLFGTIISLISAAFLKRNPDELPPATA